MKPIKETDVVVGICEREDGCILLIQRKDKNPIWDKKWEFPGGKIEANEEPEDAVGREVVEETGLQTASKSFFGVHIHDWDLPEETLRVSVHCFHCEVRDGEVVHEKEKAYKTNWVSIEEAFEYDSLKANNDILKRFVACKDTEHGLK